MGNTMLAPQRPPLPHQRLRVLAAVFLILIVGFWARFYFANLRAANDSTSAAELSAAMEDAQPLVNALEKYYADNGLYPATLTQLAPAYLPSQLSFHPFRYSARHSDWVFQSDACVTREKSLRGWVLQEAKAYQNEVAQFKHDCISGYRDFQLQSPDFSPDGQSRYLERWAYYDSAPQHWSLGWCEHVSSSKGQPSELATNGVCRWRHRAANSPRQDPWQ